MTISTLVPIDHPKLHRTASLASSPPANYDQCLPFQWRRRINNFLQHGRIQNSIAVHISLSTNFEIQERIPGDELLLRISEKLFPVFYLSTICTSLREAEGRSGTRRFE